MDRWQLWDKIHKQYKNNKDTYMLPYFSIKEFKCVLGLTQNVNYREIEKIELITVNLLGDKEYYKSVFKQIDNLAIDNLWKRYFISVIRSERHNKRNPAKQWYEILPPKITKWAWNHFDSLDLSCADNHRVALKSSSSQKRRYKRQYKKGCCGYYDVELTGPDGKQYLLGCNYGH